jgi:WS/DGAT/MGAT family acyltransferase
MAAFDATFLYAETPTVHSHVIGVLILDPSGIHDRPAEMFRRVRRRIRARLHDLPELRERIVTVPFGLAHPELVRDRHFDLDAHLSHQLLLGPGSDRQLEDLVGRFASRQLERTRPLWEMVVVEGLHDGRVALVAKLHHSIIDGIGAADLLARLLDLSPDAEDPRPLEDSPAEFIPPALYRMGTAVAERLGDPVGTTRSIGRSTRSIVRTVRAHVGAQLDNTPTAKPFATPRTSVNRRLSSRRAVAFGSVSLHEVGRAAAAFDVTINDVLLASVSGAMRRHLLEGAEPVDEPMVASVPVSVRDRTEVRCANQLTTMFVHLPVHVEGSRARVRAVQGSAAAGKAFRNATGNDLLLDLAELSPPHLVSLGARALNRASVSSVLAPMHGLVVSNVPGPPVPLYLAGARLERCHPLGPLTEGAGLNVTAMSTAHRLDLGVMVCPRMVPDPRRLMDGIVEEFRVLRDLATETAEKRPATDPVDRAVLDFRPAEPRPDRPA